MVSANRVVASGWMEASVVVFLLCYSAGLRLPLSYCFVVDYHLLIQYFPSSHFAHVSVLLYLSITHPSIMENLCSATLTTTLPSIQPLATTLMAGTILLFTAHTLPYTNPVLGYKFPFGFSNPEDGTDMLSRNVRKILPLLSV